MPRTSLRLVTLLSPVLYETYEFIARYLGDQLGLETSLRAGSELAELTRGEAELAFLCGLHFAAGGHRADHRERPSWPFSVVCSMSTCGEVPPVPLNCWPRRCSWASATGMSRCTFRM